MLNDANSLSPVMCALTVSDPSALWSTLPQYMSDASPVTDDQDVELLYPYTHVIVALCDSLTPSVPAIDMYLLL